MNFILFGAAVLAAIAGASPAREPVPYYPYSYSGALGSITTSASFTTVKPPYPTIYPGSNTTSTTVHVPPPPPTTTTSVPFYTYTPSSVTTSAPAYTYTPSPTTQTITESLTTYTSYFPITTTIYPSGGCAPETVTFTTTLTWTMVVPCPTTVSTYYTTPTSGFPTTTTEVSTSIPPYTTTSIPPPYTTIIPSGGPGGNYTSTWAPYPYPPPQTSTTEVQTHTPVPISEMKFNVAGPGAPHYNEASPHGNAAGSLNSQSIFAAGIAMAIVVMAL